MRPVFINQEMSKKSELNGSLKKNKKPPTMKRNKGKKLQQPPSKKRKISTTSTIKCISIEKCATNSFCLQYGQHGKIQKLYYDTILNAATAWEHMDNTNSLDTDVDMKRSTSSSSSTTASSNYKNNRSSRRSFVPPSNHTSPTSKRLRAKDINKDDVRKGGLFYSLVGKESTGAAFPIYIEGPGKKSSERQVVWFDTPNNKWSDKAGDEIQLSQLFRPNMNFIDITQELVFEAKSPVYRSEEYMSILSDVHVYLMGQQRDVDAERVHACIDHIVAYRKNRKGGDGFPPAPASSPSPDTDKSGRYLRV